MEDIDVSKPNNSIEKDNKELSYFKCTYEIKDTNETQILNYRSETYVNEDIGKKIKILNGNKKEELIFKKKFDNTGIHTIEFIVEEKLNNLSYLFYKCSSLKEVNFFSFNR